MNFRSNVFLLLFFLILSGSALARPYNGDVFTFTQPDGEEFQVRLYGDEYYAVVETMDGYTLAKDVQTGFYTYAQAALDGMSFLSTGVRPGDPVLKALILKKNARLSPRALKQLSTAARTHFGVDSRGQLLPSLRLRLRPRDYGHERWTPALETEALALAAAPDAVLSEAIQSAPPAGTTTGTRVGLVLLAQFPDRPADVTISQSEVDAYANDPEYTGFGNATSVYGYFTIQSDGKLQYNCIVTAYFTAAQPRDYYTNPDLFPSDPLQNGFGIRAKELINEGLAVLKAGGFDFTKADGNSDQVLDGVNIFYAGSRVNNWSEGLWPHKWVSSWDGLGVATEGVSTFFQYQITDMGSSLSLGTFSHENGHMICGFPDLYSYDGNAANLGSYSLMHNSGSTHPVNVDAYLKIHAGWATVIDVDAASHLRGAVQVDTNTFYRYVNPLDSGEYFLVSMRTNSGYEGVYGGSSFSVNPTNGLVLYHALESGLNTYSTIVTTASPAADYTIPYELMVVEANPDSITAPWYDDPAPGSDDGFHSGDVSEVSDITTPALKFWDTVTGRTVVSDLHIHSVSAQGEGMSFVVGSGAVAGSPIIGLTSFALAPTCDFGTDAASQSFSIFNSGGGTLDYTVTDNVPWLTVNPASGSATTETNLITVTYDTNSLAAGTYNGTVTIAADGVINSPQVISVTLMVFPQSAIALSTATLSKSLAAGATETDSFMISNSGGGTLSYTLSEPVSWLSLSAISGTVAVEEDEITITYDTAGLFSGIYDTTISVSSANATNSPLTIDVSLTVNGHVAVTDPDGAEIIWQDNRYDIRWLTDGAVSGNVTIELYKGGVLNSTIDADTANDGLYTWNVAAGQTLGSDYRIRITSVNDSAATGESLSDFSVTVLPTLATLPYSEGFESGFGAWSQSPGADIDWRRFSGETLSASTGPTAAQEGGFYIYTEASYESDTGYTGNPQKVAQLEGYFDFRNATAPILSFYYHMYGSAMGTLQIQAGPDQDNWTTLFSLSGDQGNIWNPAHLDLSAFAGQAVIIRITGTTGSSWTSDIALDALSVSESSKTLSYSSDIFTESGSDDGSIPVAVTISLVGDTFMSTAISGGHVTATNVPAGLSTGFVQNSDTEISFSLSGNAVNHDNRDSINDLLVQFADGAFTGGNASLVAGSSKSMTVDFIEIPVFPEIDIQGNGISIIDGDGIPSVADHTDFSSVDIGGATFDRTFTIINSGSGSLNLTGTPKVAVSGSADFSVTVQPVTSIIAGGSTTFTVRFDPGGVGLRSAILSIDNDDGDENPYNFTIQGTGTATPEMDVLGNGASIADGDVIPSLTDHTDFDSVVINGGTVDRTFTIVNTGFAPLNLVGIPPVVVGGAASTDFTVIIDPATSVSPGGSSTTFTVQFVPSVAGTRSATLSIGNDDADENPYTFAIQGNGAVVSDPEMDVQGNGISIADGDTSPSLTNHTDFDAVQVNGYTVDRTFTIVNTGTTILNLDGNPRVVIGGTHPGEFTVIADPAGSVASGGGTTIFTIRFDPGGKGVRSATVTLGNDDADENPYTFTVQGTGTVFPWPLFLPAMSNSSP